MVCKHLPVIKIAMSSAFATILGALQSKFFNSLLISNVYKGYSWSRNKFDIISIAYIVEKLRHIDDRVEVVIFKFTSKERDLKYMKGKHYT